MTTTEIKVLNDLKALTEEAGRRIVDKADELLADNQHFFSIALSGGNTPRSLYELMASEPYRSQLNWSKVEIYFGDERCLPPDHPDSNFRMAYDAMLSKLPIPECNIHRMRGELPPEQAAIEYGTMLRDKFHDKGVDLALLGMGADGHSASLFPGSAALTETHHRCAANFVAHLNSWRITMTYPFLNRSAEVMVLVAGAAKAKVLHEVLNGPRGQYPVQGIQPDGKLTWLVDAAAASLL